ncbi:trem-like transcript 4 protein [Dromiciops gliroides]|uniref:trem-like transcript 4 protein n=1 Tax=Dromiciops gliroides TaxID=33562 RepID=UPI001CC4304D|nr:trem-like transcript 4 protein [Dromiciops gliroides]
MAPEILQLLLLLSLGISDKPGRRQTELQTQEMTQISPGPRGGEVPAEEEHRLLEGETFSVNCPYKPQEHDKRTLTWCKKQENGEHCIVLETESKFSVSGKKYFSSYDSNSGIITITMSGLRVTDSGVYECGIYEVAPKWGKDVLRRFHLVVSPAQTQNPIKGMQATSEATTTSSVTNRTPNPSIVPAFYGFILIKVLVFLGFLLVLWKWYSQPMKTRKEQKR